MPDSVIASTTEEIRSTFHLNLVDHPLAGRIANTVLFGELLSDRTVLVFGGYDLVLCHRRRGNKDDEACYTTVVPRTFVERIPLGAAGMPGKAVQIRVSVSRPFQAGLRAGRPSRIKFWDLLKSMIWDGTWMEIQVEGEITVDVLSAGDSIPDKRLAAFAGTRCDQGEAVDDKQEKENIDGNTGGVLTGEKGKKAVKKKDGEIIIELDVLADLIVDIIRRRQGDVAAVGTGSGPLKEIPAAVQGSKGTPREQGNSEVPVTERGMPRAITPEMLADLMRKVVREYEEEKSNGSAAVPREPVKGGQVMPNQDLTALPLEQIPSRPGLYQTFTQNIPPPKPHGSGG